MKPMSTLRRALFHSRLSVCVALCLASAAALAQQAPGLAVPPPPPTVADLPATAPTAPVDAVAPNEPVTHPAELSGEVTASGRAGEPRVQQSVVEDDRVRIEELRVRGQTQRIVVKPKGAIKNEYEVLPADGGRDMTESAYDSRGAAGRRVWRMFSF
jgi:hypothetical protein